MCTPRTIYRILSSILSLSILLHAASVSGQVSADCHGPCPKITLPWGTWLATSYNSEGDFYTFRNIRFGQAPVGDLRFARSVTPANITNPAEAIQDSSYGPGCIAIDPEKLQQQSEGPSFGLGAGTPYFDPKAAQSEDCLFLDLYVPKSAFSAKEANIPVVVWFYGGAYVFGSKSEALTNGILYEGTSLLRMAKAMKQKMIFVVGNYRLGAFGWLAGSYMESNGLPNTGLTDQQLLLQWVQKYIERVKGDKNQVSAWGESAGGGSIVHHLIANGGKDPFFQKAILQSAAYYWAWNRTGALNETYKDFATLAGCQNHDIKCLRKLPMNSQALKNANQGVILSKAAKGLVAFGPAVDGTMIKDLPAVEFQKGNFWKGIKSLILSHVVHEADRFVPKWPTINTEQAFDKYIESIFPQQITEQIVDPKGLYKGYSNQTERLIDVARDAFFTGNILQIFNAYNSMGKPVYVAEYGWPTDKLSQHAFDLFPIFYYNGCPIRELLEAKKIPQWKINVLIYRIKIFSPIYQQYFVSHALNGDPNHFRYHAAKAPHYPWEPASINPSTGDLNRVAKPVGIEKLFCTRFIPCFDTINDGVLSTRIGNFWTKLASELSSLSSQTSKLTVQQPLQLEESPEEEL